MEALNFLQEAHRMCGMRDCDNCPVKDIYCGVTKEKYDFAKYVEIVEKWSREHPAKTWQSEFLMHYPNAILADGVIDICPAKVDTTFACKYSANFACGACKRKYWITEVE